MTRARDLGFGIRDLAMARMTTASALVALTTVLAAAQQTGPHRTFAEPHDAVQALVAAVKAGNMNELLAIFGPESQDLVASSDPATGRKNREVFSVAVAEKWQLVDDAPNRKTLVIGNEEWPFPVPIVKDASGWRFDTAAGKEEIIARRIGRNELETIATCHAYVTAQRRYAQEGHDGNPPGAYAKTFRSDPGKQNGLYWPVKKGEKRSPLGDLLAEAEEGGGAERADRQGPSPLNGYYFKILSSPGGFGLVAWPAEYNVTGVMTFIVNQDGIVREKDLGPGTEAAARKMTAYKPDASWRRSE
jgi:hypothetical protein